MGRQKKNRLPFDSAGGVLTVPRRLLESPRYFEVSIYAKRLLVLMQLHWRNERPVAYGVREASQKVPCSRKVAMRAFQELQDAGFIRLMDEAWFDSRTGSKSRTWRLTWLPFMSRPPTNEWEKLESAKVPPGSISTGARGAPVGTPEMSKVTPIPVRSVARGVECDT